MRKFISINKMLITINCVIMFFMLLANYQQYHEFSMKPSIYVDFGAIVPNKSSLLTIFSAMFLHANLFHLCMNMVSLWSFKDMEEEFGIYYLPLYLVSGIISGLAVYLYGKGLTLGASGAICGIWGANLVHVFWYKKDKIMQKAMIIDTAILIGISMLPFVSGTAHFVGLITGAIIGFIYFSIKKQKANLLNKENSNIILD